MVFTKFSSPLSLVVVHCHPDCLTCSRSPKHCDLCRDPTKLLRNGQCVHSCGLGFYQAGALCLGMSLFFFFFFGQAAQKRTEAHCCQRRGPCTLEVHNFRKPLEGRNLSHGLLGLFTCRLLASNVLQVFRCLLREVMWRSDVTRWSC